MRFGKFEEAEARIGGRSLEREGFGIGAKREEDRSVGIVRGAMWPEGSNRVDLQMGRDRWWRKREEVLEGREKEEEVEVESEWRPKLSILAEKEKRRVLGREI